jgi:hypothetical protein
MKVLAPVLAAMTLACVPNNPTPRPADDGKYFCCEKAGFYDNYGHGTGCTPVDEKDFATCGAGMYCAGSYIISDAGLYCPAT